MYSVSQDAGNDHLIFKIDEEQKSEAPCLPSRLNFDNLQKH